MVGIRRCDRPFARELGPAVGVDRRRGVFLAIRPVERAVENIVGRDLDHGNAHFAGRLGDQAGARSIDAGREILLRFGAIDGRIGGGVDDDVRVPSGKAFENAAGVGQIEIGPADELDFDPVRRRALPPPPPSNSERAT